MHVISQTKLRDFFAIHTDAEEVLRTWLRVARQAKWMSFDDVRVEFGRRIDQVGRRVVFDIGGNKFRLIARINYRRSKVFVLHVMTHAEYSKGQWK